MKATEMRDLSAAELQERLEEEQRELQNLRFQHAVAAIEDPLVLRRKRREIARLKTLLKEGQA
jgi:large subunit ribosomal protein L29